MFNRNSEDDEKAREERKKRREERRARRRQNEQNPEQEDKTIRIDPSDVKVTEFHAGQITNIPARNGLLVQKALEQGRRHFGRPGASLTQLDDPKWQGKLPEGWKRDVLDKALEGEETTSAMIQDWMKDKPGVVLIDSVHIRGAGKEEIDPDTGLIEAGDTDHIVVMGGHVLIIDSKRWRGGKDDTKIINYIQADDGSVQRFGKAFPGGKVHIAAAIRMWFDYLQNVDIEKTLLGMIHIVSDNVKVLRYRNWYDVRNKQYWLLVEKSRFIEELDAWYTGFKVRDEERRTISSDIVAQIAVCCCKPYDRMAELINMKPLEGYAV